jgi:hypothetical protein
MSSVGPVLFCIPALVCAAVYFWMLPCFDDAAPGSLAWYLALPGYLTAAPTPADADKITPLIEAKPMHGRT